jgi:hypothetical protein
MYALMYEVCIILLSLTLLADDDTFHDKNTIHSRVQTTILI